MDRVVELIKVFPWWPLTVLILAVVFRFEIRRVLNQLKYFKYKELELKFNEELREAEKEAKEAPVTIPPVREARLKEAKLDELNRTAKRSPLAAIVEAWREVEVAARETAIKKGINVENLSSPQIMQRLIAKEILPPDFQRVFDRLNNLHDQVIRTPDFVLGTDETERFVQLALGIAVALRSA